MPVPDLSEQALQQLSTQLLPGNVRELENLLHRAVALCDGEVLQFDDLQPSETGPAPLEYITAPATTPPLSTEIALPTDLQSHLDQQERDILVQTLKETGFNRTVAAQRLGLSLRQIRYRIARLKIDAPLAPGESPDA